MRSITFAFFHAVIGVSLCIGATAQAQGIEHDTARGLALGTGARSSATSTSALSYHPAGMATTRAYHVGGSFAYESSIRRYWAGGAVVDSSTNGVLAAGLALRGLFGGDSKEATGLDGRLGLSLTLLPGVLALGGNLRYMNLSRGDRDPVGLKMPDGFNVDASVHVSPVPQLSLAFLSYNLVDKESVYAPRTIGGSFGFNAMEGLVIGADYLRQFSPIDGGKDGSRVGGGIEYFVASQYPLRGGYYYDELGKAHFLSGGLGIVDRQFSLEGSARFTVSGDEKRNVFMVTAQYFAQ